MAENQREGAISNTAVGIAFEKAAKKFFEEKEGLILTRPYPVDIGLYHSLRKSHNFDLGNETTIIECKSHTWTKGNNMPSAKMSVWNEAMYYFNLASSNYWKIFLVKKSLNKNGLSLIDYYFQTRFNFIPRDVCFYEYDEDNNTCKKYTFEDVERLHK
ncbi:MAG: hypothetical protein LBM77_08785 [Spirochaetaceae bacterium]|jgi:hypothetical protein|nr:hypothetical protein [Spirochaetaceae bacterium]